MEKYLDDQGPIQSPKWTMELNMKVSDNNLMYISIGDSTVYNCHRCCRPRRQHRSRLPVPQPYYQRLNHALVAPAADPQYLPGVTLPTGVNRTAKLLKAFTSGS